MSDDRIGLRVVHRRYVPYSHAHYAGHLVDGAYSLGLFGDVATEVCIRTDGDEGLFASYSDVQFRHAVRAGDCVEVTAELVRVGSRSREMAAAFREALPRGRRPLLIVGGPRFDESRAAELGVDRVFARGTTPADVASYLVHALTVRRAAVAAKEGS